MPSAECALKGKMSRFRVQPVVLASLLLAALLVPVVRAEIFTWGTSSNGIHGYEYTEDSNDLEPFPFNPDNIKVSKVSLGGRGFQGTYGINWGDAAEGGGSFALFLSPSGQAYGWGVNLMGQLGLGDNSVDFAEKLTAIPFAKKVIDISAGEAHSLFLLEDGSVWAAGSNNHGALGFQSDNDWPHGTILSRSPVQITLPGAASQICASFYRNFVVIDGKVYGWGNNYDGVLGIGGLSTDNYDKTPTNITRGGLESETVVRLACTRTHALVLTESQKLFGWGVSPYSNLFGAISSSNAPVQVDLSATNGANITSIAVCDHRTIISSNTSSVWVWPSPGGSNSPTLGSTLSLGSGAVAGVFGKFMTCGVLMTNGQVWIMSREPALYNAGQATGGSPCNPSERFCQTQIETGYNPGVIQTMSFSNQYSLFINSTNDIWYTGMMRFAASTRPRMANRWHRPGSPTYGKIITKVGDSPYGPFAITANNEMYYIGVVGSASRPATTQDPEFTFETLEPTKLIANLPANMIPGDDMWWYEGFGAGYVSTAGKIVTWCDVASVCPGGNIPTPLNIPGTVTHATGSRQYEFTIVMFSLTNGSVGIFGGPIKFYESTAPYNQIAGSPTVYPTPEAPMWVNMAGTPAGATIVKLVSVGGGFTGGFVFLFSDGTLWWISEPINGMYGHIGFPDVAPTKITGLYTDIWANYHNLDSQVVAVQAITNNIVTVNNENSVINRGPGPALVADWSSSDGASGIALLSDNTLAYFGGVHTNKFQMQYYGGWNDGVYGPVSGLSGWPESEVNPTDSYVTVPMQPFGGRKVTYVQLLGHRQGAIALTQFYPEFTAVTTSWNPSQTTNYNVVLAGKYLRSIGGSTLGVTVETNYASTTCTVNTMTDTSLDISCVASDPNTMVNGPLTATIIRDNIRGMQAAQIATLVGLVDAPAGPPVTAPVSPPANPPVNAPAKAPANAPASSMGNAPEASPVAVPQSESGSAPSSTNGNAPQSLNVNAPSGSVPSALVSSFAFSSSNDISSQQLISMAVVLCNVARSVAGLTSAPANAISCVVAAGGAAKRATGAHTASITSIDQPTYTAIEANLASIKSSFLSDSSVSGTIQPAANNSGVGIGVGVAAAVVAVIAIIAIVVILMRRKGHNNRAPAAAQSEEMVAAPAAKEPKRPKDSEDSSGSSSASSSSSSRSSVGLTKKPKEPINQADSFYSSLPALEEPVTRKRSYSHWTIPFTEIDLGKSIGKGSFGVVYKGTWRGNTVAIKECAFSEPETLEEFLAEAEIMLRMRPNPNVVQVLGICLEGKKSYIVMEYLPKSLDKIVFDTEKRASLSDKDLIRYAQDIALGMNHIALEKIVHRDLAVRNILIGADKRAKISDFGMSRELLDNAEGQTKTNFGPLAWMAPEAIRQKFSEKSDVWSYGIVVWEIVAGQLPHRGVDRLELPLMIRNDGYHPKVPPGCPAVLAEIMNACWNFDPEKRPSFADILKIFKKHSRGSKSMSKISPNEITHSTRAVEDSAPVSPAQAANQKKVDSSDEEVSSSSSSEESIVKSASEESDS